MTLEVPKMKKTIVTLILLAMMIPLASGFVFAEEKNIDVFVSISDENGDIALAMERITVSDSDGDGVVTLNDALLTAHDEKYEGGADAGYSTDTGDWGLFITKLWGVENGGSYSYAINDSLSATLASPIKSGDRIFAYVYTDLVNFSDRFSYFDRSLVQASVGDEIRLRLFGLVADANWNFVPEALSGAQITVNGEKTDIFTDSDGYFTLKAEGSGRVVVSANSEDVTLVPPVCIIELPEIEVKNDENALNEGEKEEKVNMTVVAVASVSLVVVLAAVTVCVVKKKRK